MHQLDRIEEMLKALTGDDQHINREWVRSNVEQLVSAMAMDKKIDAIRYFRTLTGWGLKESKQVVETVMDRLRPLALTD